MNAYVNPDSSIGWLGQTAWQLPPTVAADMDCDPDFNCNASPLGELFYHQFALSAGDSVTPTPDIAVGPFDDIQPYLYWSCEGAQGTRGPCFAKGPANDFQYSYSFGNGFEGTDILANDLYVMVYYPDQIFTNGFEQE